LVGKPEGKRLIGRTTLRWRILRKWGEKMWTRFMWLSIGTMGFCEYVNEHSDCIKGGEFLD